MKNFEVVARPWEMEAEPVASGLDYSEAKKMARELGKDKGGAPYEVRERLEARTTDIGTAEVFFFRFDGGGWASFTVNEKTGEFHIHSDWGDFCYSWPSFEARSKRSLKKFIATTSDTYIADKLSLAKGRAFESIFDGEATRMRFKKRIAEARAASEISAEEADNLSDAIDEIEGDFDENADLFMMSIPGDVAEFLDDWHCDLVWKSSPQYLFLRDSLMPFFRRYLRGLLAGETAGKDEKGETGIHEGQDRG